MATEEGVGVAPCIAAVARALLAPASRGDPSLMRKADASAVTDAVSTASPASARNYGMLQAIAAFFITIKLVYVFVPGPIMDEAYYWMWGQHPGLSYFDHPPFAAWLIGLSDLVFGRSLFSLRWLTLLSMGLTFWIFQIWAKRLAGGDWPALFWPGVVIYLASPTFGYFTSLAYHDHVLLILALLSAHFFLNFLVDSDVGGRGRRRDLYLGAVFLGLATLTKYNGIFIGLGVAAYILWRPSLRHLLRDPHLWLAALLSIAMQFPVLYWNWTAGFASFDFHLNARHDDGWLRDFRWQTFLDFPAVSALLVSPFLIPVFVRFFLARPETAFEARAKGLAIWTFWLSTLTFVFVSMFDWVWWWWNLLAYIIVLPFAAQYMGRGWLFWGHVVYGALFQLVMIVSVTVFPLSILYGAPDWRQTRLYGGAELQQALEAARAKHQPDFIASWESGLASIAGFAIDDGDVTALTGRRTQFAFWWDAEAHRGDTALIVLWKGESPRNVAAQFGALTELGTTDVTRFGHWINGFTLYLGEDYQPP